MSKSECKILTYNIFHDLPAYRQLERRLRLIASEIAAERPDVIALQEVARGTVCGDAGVRLCAFANSFADLRPYRLHYARADGAGEGAYAFEDGIALMSHLETSAAPAIIKFDAQVRIAGQFGGHHYRLPDDRVAMLVRYRLGNGATIQACVTHLTDRAEIVDGASVRHLQAGELIRWIETVSDRTLPLLLAGDFNDLPASETIATITRAGFIDLWEAGGSGPGYTNDRDDIDPESPHGSPNQRIDYIFLRPGDARDFEIVDARLFLERPRRTTDGGWLWASDHVGVIARLRF